MKQKKNEKKQNFTFLKNPSIFFEKIDIDEDEEDEDEIVGRFNEEYFTYNAAQSNLANNIQQENDFQGPNESFTLKKAKPKKIKKKKLLPDSIPLLLVINNITFNLTIYNHIPYPFFFLPFNF